MSTAICLFVLAVMAAIPGAAQTVAQVEAAAGATTNLFDFNPPVGTGANRVLVAKFVVNSLAADLTLRLDRNDATTNFALNQGNIAVTSDAGANMMTLRLRDMTATDPTAVPATFRLIKATITFNDSFEFPNPAPTWHLQAQQPAAAVRFIGYWVQGSAGEAAAEALVTRPRLIVPQADLSNFATFADFANPTNVNFGGVHINLDPIYVPEHQWQFANVGTGPLQITAANPAAAPAGAYTIENYPSPPLNVLPMGSFSRRITVRPTALGPVPDVNVTLTAAPGSNLQLNLTGTTGIRLRSAILFDLSGSMLLDKHNNTTNSDADRKITLARIAALELAELYRQLLPNGLLSLSIYPNRPGNCPSSDRLIDANEISNNVQSFRNHLDRGLGHASLINPASLSSMTPMAAGIERVYNELHDRGQFERTAVFHFGDGEHNCNSGGPRPTPADWYNWPAFQNAGIPFFTVPYGATYASWLATFQQLSNKTGGATFPANMTDDLALQKEFKNALATALDFETIADPTVGIQSGQTRDHTICLNESSQIAVFSVHWRGQDSRAITIQLLPPSGPVINPNSSDPTVAFVSGANYANFVIRGSRLAGSNGAGAWTLRVISRATTDYSYQVYARDSWKLKPNLNLAGILSQGALTFTVAQAAPYLTNVQVSGTLNRPAASVPNYLATTSVSRDVINRVPDHFRDASMADKKYYVLANMSNQNIPLGRTTSQMQFSPIPVPDASKLAGLSVNPGDLAYQTTIRDLPYAGRHDFNVTITGTTKAGHCFQRQFPYYASLDPVLSGPIIASSTKWEQPKAYDFLDQEVTQILSKPPDNGVSRQFLHFTPKVGENYLGIGRANDIAINFTGAQPRGRLQDLLDGSYVQLVEYPSSSSPSATISLGSITSPAIPVGSNGLAWWIWLLIILAIIILILLWRKWRSA
ncbi:MAG: hypothetical protein JST93_01865 [Acidobacteria bacterium]|nr:hypothetical protein [Acidobacteriota bacterium]